MHSVEVQLFRVLLVIAIYVVVIHVLHIHIRILISHIHVRVDTGVTIHPDTVVTAVFLPHVDGGNVLLLAKTIITGIGCS